MTIDDLRKMFPRKGNNNAFCGPIPMAYFEAYEGEIRKAMKAWGHPLRIRYRGPRISNRLSCAWATRRCDATGAMIYLD